MAEKIANYTEEQTLKLVQDYAAGMSVESLAEALGKSVRSIVAKLSREGVYKRKEYQTKQGESPISKDELADKIAAILGLSEADAESLTKANKSALKAILSKVSLTIS